MTRLHSTMFLVRIIRKCMMVSSRMKQQRKLYSYHTSSIGSTIHPAISMRILQFCSNSPPKCWNCDYMCKSELFCDKCKVLQELPQNLTYFDIIGIKKDYNVMNEEIQKKYKELQKMLHPDKFSNKSEASIYRKVYMSMIIPH
jgi:hypothetical protein